MKEIKCPECGKTFNDTEQACPNCGCPASLVETPNSSGLSKTQNRMIALAIPIGTLSLVIALCDVFDLFKPLLGLNTSESANRITSIYETILVFITYTLLFVWFLSLYKGSVKNSKMRKISIIAMIGVFLFLIYGLIDIGTYLLKLQRSYLIWFVFSLKYVFLGIAFCALSEFFHDKLRIISLVIGVGFLFSFCCIILTPYNLTRVVIILSYLFLALFFFGFSKTYKS